MIFSEIGNLKTYWHVVALSREIGIKRSLKRTLYSTPLLIWRDGDGGLHAMADCCAHRRSPLKVGDFRNNKIVCPYHGWAFDARGKLTAIPSLACDAKLPSCQIPVFPINESDGFVWIYLDEFAGQSQSSDLGLVDLSPFSGWKSKFSTMEFMTTEELLIENFMDATHTTLVHQGLIRNSAHASTRTIEVSSNEKGVLVKFEPTEERVGPGLRWLFGGTMQVEHTDEFLPPNLVRVQYSINKVPRFLALIACTPLEAGKTLALVQLRYQFGFWNWIVWLGLFWMVPKVLRQDFEITQKQYLNQRVFSDQKESLVATDMIAVRVAAIREKIKAGLNEISEVEKSIEIRI